MTSLTYSDATTAASIAPAPGLLIAVTDPQGRVLNFHYDAKSRLAQVIDPAGQTVSYAYADSGNLGRVTFADGTSRQYLYSETAYSASPVKYPSELTGIIDEKGVRYETTTFNENNRATSNQFAGGADKISLSYYNYSRNGGVPADLTTPLGLVVTLGFADDGAQTLKPSGTSKYCGNQCNQGDQSVTYDVNGYPATTTDYKGTVTTTTYDANGLLTRQVEASGTDTQRTTSTTWDAVHRVPLTRATANAKGVVVAKNTWTYNARGQVTAGCVVDPAVTVAYACGSQAHAPSGIRQTRYTYCDAVDGTQCPQVGLFLSVDGPRTDVTDLTQYSYFLTTDESGCGTVGGACHRAGDLAQITNAAGQVTAVRDDVGGVALDAVAVGVLVVPQRALDVDLAAFLQVLARDLGQLPEQLHAVPLGALLAFAGLLVGPGFGRGDADRRDGCAGSHVAHVRVLAEIADEDRVSKYAKGRREMGPSPASWMK